MSAGVQFCAFVETLAKEPAQRLAWDCEVLLGRSSSLLQRSCINCPRGCQGIDSRKIRGRAPQTRPVCFVHLRAQHKTCTSLESLPCLPCISYLPRLKQDPAKRSTRASSIYNVPGIIRFVRGFGLGSCHSQSLAGEAIASDVWGT